MTKTSNIPPHSNHGYPMPRAAIMCWDHSTGRMQVLSSKDGTKVFFAVDPDNKEDIAKLVRYLKALSPILPPEQPDFSLDDAPEVDESQVNRYLNPYGARGSGRAGPVRATQTDILNVLDELRKNHMPQKKED